MSNLTPSQVAPIVPGTVLAGKYRVERIIGQGGMGLVVEARHMALDERVALKFLLPEYAMHPEALERFNREGRAAAKIKSEHVARVSDIGILDSGTPYMVMEFLEGKDLARTLQTTGLFAVADAVDFILQACEAIAEAHGLGIVHRDLKPANLFLSKRPDGSPLVKVLDFGISKVTGGGLEALTKTMAAMGSALYMSPEQMQQTRAVDHRTDIYALGIALYELLAGQQPYYAETLPQLCAEILTGTPTPLRMARPDIPEELAQVVEKAYARDRGNRYQSIADLAVALAPFAQARSQTTIERIARMAGLPIPTVGAAQERTSAPPVRPSSPDFQQRPPSSPDFQQRPPSSPDFQQRPPSSPDFQQQGGTQVLPQFEAPAAVPWQAPPPGVPSHDVAIQSVTEDARPSPPPQRPGSDPHQIIPGHYSAPMSSRAAALFAQGQVAEISLPMTGRPSSSPGRTGALVAVVITVLAIGGVTAAFALRSGPTDQEPKPVLTGDITLKPESTAQPSAKALPTTTAEAPKPVDSVAPPPSASAAPAVSTGSRKGGLKAPQVPTGWKPTGNPTAAPKPDIYGTSH